MSQIKPQSSWTKIPPYELKPFSYKFKEQLTCPVGDVAVYRNHP